MTRKPGFVLPVAVTLAVPVGLYVGAYCAMVRPFSLGDVSYPLYVQPTVIEELQDESNHRWYAFFFPIHWLDRRIQPHVWE